jgi:hypothetical protein
MTAAGFMEVAAILGLITGVWFALIGWKLLPLIWADGPAESAPHTP